MPHQRSTIPALVSSFVVGAILGLKMVVLVAVVVLGARPSLDDPYGLGLAFGWILAFALAFVIVVARMGDPRMKKAASPLVGMHDRDLDG